MTFNHIIKIIVVDICKSLPLVTSSGADPNLSVKESA